MDTLLYKGVDIMKFTKDTINNQPSEAMIRTIVQNIKKDVHPTHIAISVPMNETIPNSSPLSAWEFVRMICYVIHSEGLKVLHRGTFCEIEGIWGFTKAVGANRKPTEYYLNEMTRYINSNGMIFAHGDIWAPFPERTENIWSDSTSFLPHAPNIQQNYRQFFLDVKQRSDQTFTALNKQVVTGMTANNWSEVNSGWLPQEMYTDAGVVSFDHYGINHTPQEMQEHLNHTYRFGIPMFHQEWSDYWNGGMSMPERLNYLRSMYDVFTQFANEGKLIGFNYWGGWPGTGESILNPDLTVNEYGKLLGEYYGAPTEDPEVDPGTEMVFRTHIILNEGIHEFGGPWELESITITSRSLGKIEVYDGDTLMFPIRDSALEQTIPVGITFQNLKIKKSATGALIIRIATPSEIVISGLSS